MGIANEQSSTQYDSLLKAGLQELSRNQQVFFQKYQKVVLTQDGYVFWVASGPPTPFVGSLHVASDRVQEEDQTIGINTFIFTSESEITELNEISPLTMWVGSWSLSGETTIQIAFSKRGPYYRSADIWHYSGYAVYPALASQLVNNASNLPVEPIVSNSLPIWLALESLGVSVITAYPSFLVEENIPPPYVSVHISPDGTEALQQFPLFQWPGNPSPITDLQQMTSQQLTRDKVRLTFYGLNNQQVIQYFASLMDYSLNTDILGFMSAPIPKDEKRAQVEIRSLAMKKTLELDISYYQSTSDAIARRLISSVLDMSVTIA
ncbi:MAG: hypothetical protein GJU73_05315 [Ferrovum sp.]|jgi:hypothetical protein|uniref:hypothetical protein n=1 Tax=Ferrovum sp. TaxID=2609467 RepID=UPI00260509A7|nr:hypothetical protein [Ferrovum sp.]MBW8066848.1 hypothetical protein [Ferrovum sp.]